MLEVAQGNGWHIGFRLVVADAVHQHIVGIQQ